MKRITVPAAESGATILLGRERENAARQIVFDCAPWRALYGPGTIVLLAERSGDERPYPAALAAEGDEAVWTVSAADTARPGYGRCELQYHVGGTLAKSQVWRTFVAAALGEADGEVPEPEERWIETVTAAGASAVSAAAEAATAAATAAESAADAAQSERNAKRSEEAAVECAQAVASYVGDESWLYPEMDEDGVLYMVMADSFRGAEFALTEDGFLEVELG